MFWNLFAMFRLERLQHLTVGYGEKLHNGNEMTGTFVFAAATFLDSRIPVTFMAKDKNNQAKLHVSAFTIFNLDRWTWTNAQA